MLLRAKKERERKVKKEKKKKEWLCAAIGTNKNQEQSVRGRPRFNERRPDRYKSSDRGRDTNRNLQLRNTRHRHVGT